MVDTWGNWTYEPNTPEEKKCDCDRLADWIIIGLGYKPKTSIEQVVNRIILIFDDPSHYGEYDSNTGFGGYGDGFTVEGCKRFVEEEVGYLEYFDDEFGLF